VIYNLNKYITLSDISSFSIVIPLLVGIITYKRNKAEQHVLFWYIALATITEFVSVSLAGKGKNNLPVFHLFTVLEFIFLVYFYKLALGRINTKLRIYTLIGVFIGLAVINAMFLEDIYSFNTNLRTLESLVLILLSVYFLFNLTAKSEVLYITDYPNFVASAAILFYFSGSLFLFASSRIFLKNWLGFYPAIWSIHAFFNIGFNLLLAKTLWNRQKE
jgi:hypothetical protein